MAANSIWRRWIFIRRRMTVMLYRTTGLMVLGSIAVILLILRFLRG